MDDDPDWPPPPEGALIRKAREMAIPKISRTKAAQLAGIDPGTFGMAERGYRDAGGSRHKVHTPDSTYAKMAAAVGVTPQQMAAAGQNQHAAALLAELTSQPGPHAPGAVLPDSTGTGPAPETAPDPGLAPYITLVREALGAAIRQHGPAAAGAQAFPDSPSAAAIWDNPRIPPAAKELLLARLLQAEGPLPGAADGTTGSSARN
jgi:hypothetical protein